MNSVRYTLPHPTSTTHQRPVTLRLAVVLYLIVAAGLAWILTHATTDPVCTQCPIPIPVPTAPALPVEPPSRSPHPPASQPTPEAVPTPSTLEATPSPMDRLATGNRNPVAKNTGVPVASLAGQPGFIFLAGAALMMAGLLVWARMNPSRDFHPRSFNG